MAIKNYGLITEPADLAACLQRVHDAGGPFGFDIETGYTGSDRLQASLHPETAILVGISLTSSTDWARYLPLGHDHGENFDNTSAAIAFWHLLNTGRGVAHNAAFELRHLSRWFRDTLGDHPTLGAAVRAANGYFPVRSDTQVEAYLAADYPFFGLKPLVAELFGHTMTELHELFDDLPVNRRKYLRFNVLDPSDPRVMEYACEDSAWCLALHQHYHPRVSAMGLYPVEHLIATACVPEMEDVGVRYDWPMLRRAAEQLRGFRDRFNAEIMTELSTMAGATVAINLGSPPQIGKILYTTLGMRTSVYTAGSRDKPRSERKMSTGKTALTSLANTHPVVKKILQWKEMTRLLGTYLDKYETLYGYAADGHTHPHHMSAVVITGRFAVSDPPYQASPKKYHYDLDAARAAHEQHREAHGKDCRCEQFPPPPGTCFTFNFRDAVTAPPEHYLLGFDLSQAELRAIAGEAKEEALLRAFATGQDVHALTAALMLRIAIEQVGRDERDIGKTMNFALLYGLSIKSLADRLGITVEEATALHEKYFAAYPAIAAWRDKQIRHGRAHGYVTSRFGRKLPIWDYRSADEPGIAAHVRRARMESGDRTCVNYPIQGAATGDMVKIGMVRARAALRAAGLHDRVHMVMNIHDALEFYVHRSITPQQVITVLQPAVIFEVPGWPAMAADWHMAKRWGSPVELTVADDGVVSVRGGPPIAEPAPAVVLDEDTGEQVETLPEVDPEILRHAVDQLRPAGVVIALTDMPTDTGYRAFRAWLTELPGAHPVTLRTPQGDLELHGAPGYGVQPEHTGAISGFLGPVTISLTG